MKYNIGSIERVLRVLVGFGILSLAFIGPASPWGYLGLVPIVTGLVGWCPLFAAVGATTCDKAGSCPRPHGV
ncbi:MAG: DUF2892 domain-containing protein [Desulfobulbaceae bacterium]|nr:DUF2892 domain-containing protein [Desulfobulbaceae bacterium]